MSAVAPSPAPVALRISVTDRCQLRCAYCLPRQGPRALHAQEDILRDGEIVEFVRAVASAVPVEKIRLTGGEPLLRPGLVGLVRQLRAVHAGELALTTNGQQLAAWAAPLREAGLDRINLSLDSLDPQTFAELSGGGTLAATFAGLAAARNCGFAGTKINMVVLRGVNDREILPMVRHACEREAEVRFLELMPIGPLAARHAERFFSTADVQAALRAEYELEPVPRRDGSTSRSWVLRRAGHVVGHVGFISSNSHPFCKDCRRIRLTADGRMMGCLAQAQAVPVREWLSAGEAGRSQLRQALADLLAKKSLRDAFRQPRAMAEIGG